MGKEHVTEIGVRSKPTVKVDDNFWRWYGKGLVFMFSFKWIGSMVKPIIMALGVVFILVVIIMGSYISSGDLSYWSLAIIIPLVITDVAYLVWSLISLEDGE